MLDAGEDGLHREEVGLGDGVELVIVALRAAHRGGEKGGAGGVDHVAQLVLPLHLVQERVLPLHPVPRTRHDEAGGGVLAHGVAGELLEDEAVVGFVVVEGADDVVAVMVGVGPLVVRLEPVRIRVSHHVEPVPGPALAEMRAVEQAVGQCGDGAIDVGGVGSLGFDVVEELPRGVFVRKEARHIERHAPQEHAGPGRWIEGEAFLFQLRLDEGVDGVGMPVAGTAGFTTGW